MTTTPTANADTGINLYAWCAARAASFRDFEDHEMAMYPSPEHRDAELVAYVVRCLANPKCDGSAATLELIDRQRAVSR